MSHVLFRVGRFAARRPWTVIGVWAVVAVLVVGASGALGQKLQDSFVVPGLDSTRATGLLTKAQSDSGGLTAQVVLTPPDDGTFFDSADARAELAEVKAAVADLPKVLDTTDPASALAAGPKAAKASGSVSPDGRVALIRVQYPVVEELDVSDLDNLKQLGADVRAASALQVELGGDLFFAFEAPPAGVGEMIGLVVAAVVLLVAFGSVIAMGLPIGMALFGLALGISSMPLITYLVSIPSFAPQLAAMVGLGVGIDYALFLVTRHREFLSRGMSVEESVGRAVATAGQAVVFAGGAVVIAILGLAVAGIPFLTAAGIAISVIVSIMVLAAVTLLPAFLGVAGARINRFGIHRRQPAMRRATVSAGWLRWGGHVSSNAWAYAVGATACLLALAAPVLDLRLGFPDEGALPDTRTERRAYDLVADGFGPGSNGPLVIAVDVSDDPSVVDPLVSAVRADDGIAAISPAQVNTEAGVATLIATPTTSPQDEATVDTITRLRAEVLPQVLDGRPARAHIGGQTATWADIGGKVSDRLPLFVGTVIALSFLLLVLVFRSVLVPLKAALLNLLSVGAAYGVLVAVFQWGWGMDLIGLESTVPIISFIPLLMFAVLFGLSMDYEVFLLSRIREHFRVSGDNEASVIGGIASTARVITSAALIMISVFLAFVLAEDPAVKMMGLGLATAILVDATIVRMILVPATMTLLGDANWWLPGWLDRLLPAVDTGDGAATPHLDPDVDPADDAAARHQRALVR